MHVCIIQTILDPYKGGNHLPLFAACSNTQFTILCNRSKASPEDLPNNVSVVTVPGRIGPYYYGIADALFARQVMKVYRTGDVFWKQFDVIHLNQVMGPALRFLKKTAAPLLFLIHHPVTADREIALDQTNGISNMLWCLKYSALIRFQRFMCHAADRIVTVSQTMQKRIAADYSIAADRISVVENGVDGDVFTFTPDADCTYDIAAVGSFVHPRKGFPYLLEVYKSLTASGLRIVDVGRRSDVQRQQLTAITGVESLGTVDGETLIHSLRQSRILVSTSLFEGFGLSLIEALACGHPAVAFGVGAVPEVLGKIDPSLVVPPRDTMAMVQAVESFLNKTPQEREALGAQYRVRVLETYSLRKSAEALEALYADVVS